MQKKTASTDVNDIWYSILSLWAILNDEAVSEEERNSIRESSLTSSERNVNLGQKAGKWNASELYVYNAMQAMRKQYREEGRKREKTREAKHEEKAWEMKEKAFVKYEKSAVSEAQMWLETLYEKLCK